MRPLRLLPLGVGDGRQVTASLMTRFKVAVLIRLLCCSTAPSTASSNFVTLWPANQVVPDMSASACTCADMVCKSAHQVFKHCSCQPQANSSCKHPLPDSSQKPQTCPSRHQAMQFAQTICPGCDNQAILQTTDGNSCTPGPAP